MFCVHIIMLCPPSASEYFVATFRKLICFITLTLIRSEIIIVETEYHLLILMKMRFSSRLIYYFIEHPLAPPLSNIAKMLLNILPKYSHSLSVPVHNSEFEMSKYWMEALEACHVGWWFLPPNNPESGGRGGEGEGVCWCLKVCFLCLTPAHCSAQ